MGKSVYWDLLSAGRQAGHTYWYMVKKKTAKRPSSVRIIGGTWRGTRVELARDTIRPTGDRVRETLFNWLDSEVRGREVLDLFAGTGALGLEALSRGAKTAVFIEKDPTTAAVLKDLLVRLEHAQAAVNRTDARGYLKGEARPFDLVFLDPPFADRDLDILCKLLEDRHWLAPEALLYIETDRDQGIPALPGNWQVLKKKTAGDVEFALVQRQA
ncbi:MAG: 16S rRNA (guanine(966)-N(2))-methyltransferase RsmD [Gammaproteobacteria bacterium]